MERKERKEGRGAEAGIDSTWNSTKQKKRTDEWMEPKERRRKCWIVGWEARRGHLLLSLSSSPVPPLPPRENASLVCVFSYSLDVRRFHSCTKTGRRHTWHEATWRNWQRCVSVRGRERDRERKLECLTCLADSWSCESRARLSEMSHLTHLTPAWAQLSSILLYFFQKHTCAHTYTNTHTHVIIITISGDFNPVALDWAAFY